MADGASMKVAGLAESQRKMLMLPDNVDRKVARKAVFAGCVPIRDEAILQAPEYHGQVSKGHPPPGTLKHSIIAKFIPEESKGGHTVYYVLVRHGKRYQKQGAGGKLSQDAFYWWWVEFKKANNPNSKAFMRPAFELQKEKAKDAIIDTLGTGIMEEAAKL